MLFCLTFIHYIFIVIGNINNYKIELICSVFIIILEVVMQKILIATKNPGKLEEFKVLLKDLNIEIVSLDDLGITHEVEENGKTFDENAIKKTREYSKISGLTTISE